MSKLICTPIKTEIVTIQDLAVEVLMYLSENDSSQSDVRVSFISLDMKWCKPGRGDRTIIGKWHALFQDDRTHKYYFQYHMDRIGLHEEVISMVKAYHHTLFEQQVLGDESETRTK